MNRHVPQTVTLPGGEKVPALGQGTWMMGQDPSRRAEELSALVTGIDLGLTLIDTAEMYGDGRSEDLVGEAIAWRRDAVFLVSKVYPQNAGGARLERACTQSLRRLKTDRLDLYLLHWRGGIPLVETVAGMAALQAAGKIRHWGVSNLDADDMAELLAAGGSGCATNQVLYNLGRRGPEYDLLPWLQSRAIPVMAYSPVEQGRLLGNPRLAELARAKGVTPAQLALAWVMRRGNVVAIPKAANSTHVKDNAAARDLVLDADDLAALDKAFPPPRTRRPLEML